MDIQEIFSKKSKFATRTVGSDLILVPLKNNVADMNELFTLNEVGCFIWENIDGVKSIDDILNAMIAEFEIDESTACNDLNEFMERLEVIMDKA